MDGGNRGGRRPLNSDVSPDIGWWTRTFHLPKEEGQITTYLKNEGVDATSVVPIHYEDTPQATTITYQVKGDDPGRTAKRAEGDVGAPVIPSWKPFAPVVLLNHDLPPGQFWNTAQQKVARPAGTPVDVAWKVSLDKSTQAVTADQMPFPDGGIPPQQVAQYEAETNNTVNQLKAQVAGDRRTRAVRHAGEARASAGRSAEAAAHVHEVEPR